MNISITTALGLAAALLAVQPALADGIKDRLSRETLAAYCANVPTGSHTTTTLIGRDGQPVTGRIHCEAEDLRVSASADRSDDGHRRGRGSSDDDCDDDDWDDDWDDDRYDD